MITRIGVEAIIVVALFQSVCQSSRSDKTGPRNEGLALSSAQENTSTPRKIETPRIKLFPRDEASKDHSFLVFRSRFLAAVKNHDRNFILGNIDPGIMNGDDIEKGVNEFKKRWQLDQEESSLWDLLTSIVSNGGSFNTDKGEKEFCAPYAVSEWRQVANQLPGGADPLGYVAITAKDVDVREKPNANSPIIFTLSYDVVRVDSNGSVRGGSPPHVFTWVKITIPSGQEGYVMDKYVQGPMDYRACFRKVEQRWLMTELAARE